MCSAAVREGGQLQVVDVLQLVVVHVQMLQCCEGIQSFYVCYQVLAQRKGPQVDQAVQIGQFCEASVCQVQCCQGCRHVGGRYSTWQGLSTAVQHECIVVLCSLDLLVCVHALASMECYLFSDK